MELVGSNWISCQRKMCVCVVMWFGFWNFNNATDFGHQFQNMLFSIIIAFACKWAFDFIFV